IQRAVLGDYHHTYTCPGDTITIWWNDKGVGSHAQITNVPNPPLDAKGQTTFEVPAMSGDTVYHISEGQNIYPGAQDATNTVVGPNGSIVHASAGVGPQDAVTGQLSYNSTLLQAIFSKGLHVKSIKILESPGVGTDVT